MKVLALDPGMTTGCAYMEEGQVLDTTVLSVDREAETIEEKFESILDELYELLDRDIDVVVIEMPEPWGSYKSLSSSRRGDLQNLFFFVGALWKELHTWATNFMCRVHLVKVSTWKGQKGKPVTYRQMCKKYGEENVPYDGGKYHRSDAIGVGDYWLRKGGGCDAGRSGSSSGDAEVD